MNETEDKNLLPKKLQNLAYVRVSTQDQSCDRQREALKAYNIDRFFEDKITGVALHQPELENLKSHCREGDCIFIYGLDRIGRSSLNIMNHIQYFLDRGCYLNILNLGGISFMDVHKKTKNPLFNVLITLFGVIAEIERNAIKERTMQGIKLKISKGGKWGRPTLFKKEEINEMVRLYLEEGVPTSEIAKRFNIKQNTFLKYVRSYRKSLMSITLFLFVYFVFQTFITLV